MSSPGIDNIQIVIQSGAETTDLIIGRGLLSQASKLLTSFQAARLAIVADDQIADRYAIPLCTQLTRSGYTATLLRVHSGERHKSLETLTDLYTACLELALDRNDCIIAVGGGMVGDLAGMLAGTYMRGLSFIQVPTSLVAQITASIGGKVGVNFRGHKNLIGMFNQPAMVLVDLDTLATLPADEFRSGLGELVTVGMLGAPAIFTTLEAEGAAQLEPLILEAIRCKARIVEADPFERNGIRHRLNLGHTFGHALETLSDFTLPHGLAVAVGLHIATRLAAECKLCAPHLVDRVQRTLTRLNLPLSTQGYSPDQVIEAMRADKKRRGGQLRWVLPRAVGEVMLVHEDEVPRATLEAVLRDLVWAGCA